MDYKPYLILLVLILISNCDNVDFEGNCTNTKTMLPSLQKGLKSKLISYPNQKKKGKYYSEVIVDKRKENNHFLLFNNTDSIGAYYSQDGYIKYIQEALDGNGVWRPIEYWQSSWCGNSYYISDLKRRTYKSFEIRRYTGEYKTKLRIKYQKGEEYKYSPEFEGKINNSQFEKPSKKHESNFLENTLQKKR